MENKLITLLAKRLASWMNQYTHKEGFELLKLEVGIECILINISKMIIIYTLATLLGVLLQTFIIHFAFVLTKRYSFGAHALNSTVCTIVSCCMFVIAPLIMSGVGITNQVVIIVFAAIIYTLYKFAPADTKARPLIGAKLRKQLKKRATICGIILLIITLLIPNESIKLLLVLGAVYQCISILPITYKILGRSTKNYEKYECAS